MSDELIAEGMAAEFDLDDLEIALNGSGKARQRAIMRLISGAYKRGSDECEQCTKDGRVGRYDFTTGRES